MRSGKSSVVRELTQRSRDALREVEQSVEEIRQENKKLQISARKVKSEDVSEDVALARVDQWAADLGQRVGQFAPEPGRFARSEENFSLPLPDLVSALGAYLTPLLAEKAKEQVRQFYKHKQNAGISSEERAQRLAEIDRKILELELAEEALIRDAEKVGFMIVRRMNANPLAVLAHDEVLA